MANGLGAGPSAIVTPDVNQLIGRPDIVVEPRSTAMLTDAFRQGFITADDIMERVGERSRMKKKVDIEQSKQVLAELQDPELIQARRNQQLAAGAQAEGALANAPLAQKAKEWELKAAIFDAQSKPGGFDAMQNALTKAGFPVSVDVTTGLTDTDKAEIQKRFASLTQFETRKAEAESRVKGVETKFFPTEKPDPNRPGGKIKEQLEKIYQNGQEISHGQLKSWTQEAEALRKQPFSSYYFSSLQPGQVATAPVAAPAAAPAPVTPNIIMQGPTAAPTATPAPVAAVAPAPVATPAPAQPTTPTGRSFVTGIEEPTNTRPLQENAMQSALMANKNIQNSDAANAAYVPIQHILRSVSPDGAYPKTVKDKKFNDFSLIVGLAKIIDPNSVVREGEVKKVEDAQSILVKYGINPASLEDTVGIATGQQYFSKVGRQTIVSLIEAAHGQHLENARKISADNANEANRLGLNPSLAVGPSRYQDLQDTGWKVGQNYTPRQFAVGARLPDSSTGAGQPTRTETLKSGVKVGFIDGKWETL